MKLTPVVTIRGVIDMQVCVPKDWSDDRVVDFANRENPAGTDYGWYITRAGDRALNGDPERTTCQADDRSSAYVHIMLHC